MAPLKFKKQLATSNKPLWEGPSSYDRNGGISFSMLARYLCCAERFRLGVIEGWRPVEQFNAAIDYGSMWHICEEALAKYSEFGKDADLFWKNELLKYAQGLCSKFPMQREQVNHWYQFCKYQFPLYIDYWAKHPDVTERTPLLQEQIFDVPYKLPSGRVVRLRGKWDSVDLIGKGKGAGVYLMENKTKSSIDETKVTRQLMWDIQTTLYLIAIQAERENREVNNPVWDKLTEYPLHGVRYNVIRRSSHKSLESFQKKLEEDKAADRLGEWFARWKVEFTPGDIERFKKECLNPVLENLCDDYAWWVFCLENSAHVYNYLGRETRFPKHRRRHFRMPYLRNPVTEGGSSDLDALLNEGSTIGLEKATTLFRELEP